MVINKGKKTSVYLYLGPIVGGILGIFAIVGLGLLIKHKMKYPKRPKEPAWKKAPLIQNFPSSTHQYEEEAWKSSDFKCGNVV